jgi:hypothetical protein
MKFPPAVAVNAEVVGGRNYTYDGVYSCRKRETYALQFVKLYFLTHGAPAQPQTPTSMLPVRHSGYGTQLEALNGGPRLLAGKGCSVAQFCLEMEHEHRSKFVYEKQSGMSDGVTNQMLVDFKCAFSSESWVQSGPNISYSLETQGRP